MFDQNIKQPSHDKIMLTNGAAYVTSEIVSGGDDLPFIRVTAQRLDENDAIRLAAFLNRWYRERNRAEITLQKAEIEASRAAKKQRYEKRRETRDA
jgi:hypothetical protein